MINFRKEVFKLKIRVMCREECFAYAHGWGKEYNASIEDMSVPTMIISISSYDTPIPNILQEDEKENPLIKHVEFCQFDDIDSPIPIQYFVPISEDDAKRIVDAVEKYKDEVEEIVVHCDAGYSRSPAVAAAISLWLNGTDDEFFNPLKYCPNRQVYRTVLKEIEKRGYFY